MSVNIWNLEWLNHNSQRSYPIADWANKECADSSAIVLPDDFILALSLAINSAHNIDISKFYIKSILVTDTGCTVIVGYNAGNPKDVAVTHILTNSEQYTYTLTGLDDFYDCVGYIALNPNSQILKNLSGYYTFNQESTTLEPDCIRPMIKAFSSVQVNNSNAISSKLYGDIVLKAGTNMDISVSGNTITFSAINNNKFEEDCECAVDEEMTPITSINGVEADSDGNITLTGSSCLNISSASHGVSLNDTCSEPCCGCAELDALYDNIKDSLDGAATLKNTIEKIDAKQQQVELVYGSSSANSCNCKKEEE